MCDLNCIVFCVNTTTIAVCNSQWYGARLSRRTLCSGCLAMRECSCSTAPVCWVLIFIVHFIMVSETSSSRWLYASLVCNLYAYTYSLVFHVCSLDIDRKGSCRRRTAFEVVEASDSLLSSNVAVFHSAFLTFAPVPTSQIAWHVYCYHRQHLLQQRQTPGISIIWL